MKFGTQPSGAAMPRYYFDYSCDHVVSVDDEGVELSSPSEARLAALDALADFLRDLLPSRPAEEISISVRDESGRLVFTTSISMSMRWGYLG